MKNNFLIALGLVLAVASATGIASASRDAYHNYQYQSGFYARNYNAENPDNLKVRVSTKRTGAWQARGNRFVETQKKKKTVVRGTQNLQRNYRGSREQADWADEKTLVVRKETSNRHFARREGRWQAVSSVRSAVSYGKIPEVKYGKTFEADSYLVNLPESFEVTATDETLLAQSENMTVTVKKIENSCGKTGFYACGTTLSKSLNGTGLNEIRTSSRVERAALKTFKYLADNRETQTFTESFTGIKEGKELFIARYFVADSQGNLIYIIEGQSPRSKGGTLVANTKLIFNSFHIKGE